MILRTLTDEELERWHYASPENAQVRDEMHQRLFKKLGVRDALLDEIKDLTDHIDALEEALIDLSATVN